ncbi:hypothetical protein [Chromobacterium subtsugae]|uniref:hypothetical protein n=1 Tax=Chromobacterium subtsugae TaxID=251747 RepID=UPI00064146F6|nr:hypothetical protein [Chromobacterium subtsugae]
MPPFDAAAWSQAISQAGREQDWRKLAQLDQALRRLLSEGEPALDAGQRRLLADAYRAALDCSQAEIDALRHKLAAMGQQREGQMAYAQFSEWEQA